MTRIVGVLIMARAMADDQGNTDVTDRLNDMMTGSGGYYTAGKGVFVRDVIDGLQNTNYGVPATFWSNDIYGPSQMYPDRVDLDVQGTTEIYHYASVGIVVGTCMTNILYEFDNIQDSTWGWGVFYAHDSNSVDIRCRYLASYSGYDCPGGWIDQSTGTFTADNTHTGSGAYPVGNPYANANWGGGTGCHFSRDSLSIDQINAYDSAGDNLVEDYDCQCNYKYKSDWSVWVDDFASNFVQSSVSLYGDMGICWVNNLPDMISMQNWLFWKHAQGVWSDNQGLFAGSEEREYMGWNEVPVTRVAIDDPSNWDAFLIKLPANICDKYDGGQDSIWCLAAEAQTRLGYRIDGYVKNNFVKPGWDQVAERPGSYTVVAREWKDTSGNWQRWFFCETWQASGVAYVLYWKPETTSFSTGACYMDFA